MATESDNVNSGALGTLLAVGTFATLGIALVVTALVRSETSEELEKKELGADRPYRDLVAEQTAKMAAPAAYVDRGHGLVSLPIDRAMELTVSGLMKDPNSATPPAPVGGAGGSSATSAGGTTAEMGGTGGTATEEAKPAAEATHAEQGKPAEEAKPAEEKKKDEKKKDEKKKDGAKPKPVVPAAPAPAAPAPAAPAPNGQ